MKYVIRTLDWKDTVINGDLTRTHAGTILGSLTVERTPTKRWRWSWCFQEWYDEGNDKKTFRTVDEAKAAAETFYRDRLEEALDPVEED